MNSQEKFGNALSLVDFPHSEGCIYKSQFVGLDNKPCATQCFLCSEIFTLPTNETEFLTHLFREHRLVIGDVWKIASLKSYVHYWSVKFKEEQQTNFCTTLLMDCTPDGQPSKNEVYFLLSDCISEDKTLRDELHRAKLEWALMEQSKDRMDTNFKRGCIFCRMEFSGSRVAYIKHLSQKHNLHIGQPENLVFLDEFIDKIQTTIESLICIYCEKVFKDRTALKEHMRKKLHKRINPKNTSFDKYYINNYLEPDKTWRHKQGTYDNEDHSENSSNEDEEASWSGWNDENGGINCLLCNNQEKDIHTMLNHIKTDHCFDFQAITQDLTFYQKIKVVNYIRRQIQLYRCIFCDLSEDDVLIHMQRENHCKLPPQSVWDQPEFYFPTCNNDSFLYHLDDSSNSDEENDVQNEKR